MTDVKQEKFEPDCQFQNECSSRGINCASCRHNKQKKSHYEPVQKQGPQIFMPAMPNPVWKAP